MATYYKIIKSSLYDSQSLNYNDDHYFYSINNALKFLNEGDYLIEIRPMPDVTIIPFELGWKSNVVIPGKIRRLNTVRTIKFLYELNVDPIDLVNLAIKYSNLSMLQFLISHCIKIPSRINYIDEWLSCTNKNSIKYNFMTYLVAYTPYYAIIDDESIINTLLTNKTINPEGIEFTDPHNLFGVKKYGKIIIEVYLPANKLTSGDLVVDLIGKNKFKTNYCNYKTYISTDHLELYQIMIKLGSNIHEIFYFCVRNNKHEIVKYLLENYNYCYDTIHYATLIAALNSHIDIFETLIIHTKKLEKLNWFNLISISDFLKKEYKLLCHNINDYSYVNALVIIMVIGGCVPLIEILSINRPEIIRDNYNILLEYAHIYKRDNMIIFLEKMNIFLNDPAIKLMLDY
ncbi:putative ankyrin repeat protein [Cotonvirus japonicus]|uniref:Ankyrin repeat protein n=1 Tax=Cotonvirus japonicus TaxID=2811091 RepID=A0ABM7NTV9_9VIRU|nr:putative ankyrin repeat protein [Cotonvirus japonicus]BCS83531.1 putative ankyrin repeat protein [Cotonvirus japonicus]